MNSTIAKRRMSEVMKTDTVTTSDGDFMATHVPVKRLHLLKRFEMAPQESASYTEEEVYQKIVKNPDNQHQFVIVYGDSGTGKSHLIRWFKTKFINDNDRDEAVLFIRRSDNTLKGTIRQLLSIDEVQNIPNRDIYKRLVEATSVVNEDVLKRTIYATFQVLIESDTEDQYNIRLTNIERKRLLAFLRNALVTAREMDEDGPVERIYSKIAEKTYADRDTIAEFKSSDFIVDGDFLELLESNGADRNAINMANKLAADDDGSYRDKITRYMNQFINPVIQQCANLEPGDFEQVFREIRRELYRQGKNLTLFIEDITAFTGVDIALLNVLTTSHTGAYEEEHMCRISSIVGTTRVYFQNNFNDNHKDRVTQFIYIPTDLFDDNGLYEFVGKYLNTISLEKDQVDDWTKNGALDQEYPVHELIEGEYWDTYTCTNGKKLCLYPFSKNAIKDLYKDKLSQDSQRTPRYFLSDVMEPVIQDALYNKDNFPSKSLHLTLSNMNSKLRTYITQQSGGDRDLEDRLITFAAIWGNNEASSYKKGNTTYIAGINEHIYEDLNMPLIKMEETVQPPKTIDDNGSDTQVVPDDREKSELTPAQEKKISEAAVLIEDWVRGGTINTGNTQGANGLIRAAVQEMNSYIYNVVNWQSEGISNDDMSRIYNSNISLIGLDRQNKGKAFYSLPADRQTQTILECFIRYNEKGKGKNNEPGKGSWNYAQSEDDLYFVTNWVYSIKDAVVKALKNTTDPKKTSYVEVAMISEMIQLILNGTYSGKKTLRDFGENILFDAGYESGVNSPTHSREWNDLLTKICMGNDWHKKNYAIVTQYFNIIQGKQKASSVFYIDSIDFEKTLKKAKSTNLSADHIELQTDDVVKQRRDVDEQLLRILDRCPKVAEAEKENARSDLGKILEAFGMDDVEDIDKDMISEFATAVKKFHKTINDKNINVRVEDADLEKVRKKPAIIAAAIASIYAAEESDDVLEILLAFSGDPLKFMKPLSKLISIVKEEMDKVDADLKKKVDGISTHGESGDTLYTKENQTLENTDKIIESMRCLYAD